MSHHYFLCHFSSVFPIIPPRTFKLRRLVSPISVHRSCRGSALRWCDRLLLCLCAPLLPKGSPLRHSRLYWPICWCQEPPHFFFSLVSTLSPSTYAFPDTRVSLSPCSPSVLLAPCLLPSRRLPCASFLIWPALLVHPATALSDSLCLNPLFFTQHLWTTGCLPPWPALCTCLRILPRLWPTLSPAWRLCPLLASYHFFIPDPFRPPFIPLTPALGFDYLLPFRPLNLQLFYVGKVMSTSNDLTVNMFAAVGSARCTLSLAEKKCISI